MTAPAASLRKPLPGQNDTPVLAIEHLDIGIRQADRSLRRVVDDFNLTMRAGEIVALVGESGSGKTMIGRAVLQLLPQVAAVESGRIDVGGEPLPPPGSALIRSLRGREVGMVFQEPMVSLNPALTVGVQMSEALILHYGLSKNEARERCLAMLKRVRIVDPAACFNAYPHQFSGGMRQRIMLASVLVMEPRLLIADEPTTALDAIIQKEVMDIMVSLTREMGTAVLLVSHDLAMVAHYANRVVVLRRGETMESGDTGAILFAPQHDYTRALLDSMPSRQDDDTGAGSDKVLIEARGVCVDFTRKAPVFWRKPSVFRAVTDVDFSVREGETLAVVGESGSGKTTLGRILVRLARESAGTLRFDGKDIGALSGQALKQYRLQTQMVFQDPFSSLDPRMRLADIVAEGLRNMPGLSKAERRERACAMLAEVGLPGDYAERHPHELSGGQRQRICIARAVVAQPRFVVADEPVSALDVTIQKQILELMRNLQHKFGFSYMFISHDLGVVEQIADRVAVMYRGRILEVGSRNAIYDRPRHPYTRLLLQATPRITRTAEGGYRLAVHPAEAVDAPVGYHYYNHGSIAGAPPSTGAPVLVRVADDHEVACARA